MMNKRGTSHADWAISLGIFLLYILSMLMLIQPGVQPFYKEGELLNIVTENYRLSTSFVFYKTPLVIDTTGLEFTPGSPDYLVTINTVFPFSGSPNDYAVTDADLVPLDNFYIAFEWDTVRFNAPIIPDVPNKFYIISNKPADGISLPYDDRGTLDLGQPEIFKDTNFALTIGSTEVLQGVSAELLARDVDAGGINCQAGTPEEQAAKSDALKASWGFPRSKDFMIFYANTASAMYNPEDAPAGSIIPVCRQELPYEQASVVVEEWATRIVDELGNTAPIRMVARVW